MRELPFVCVGLGTCPSPERPPMALSEASRCGLPAGSQTTPVVVGGSSAALSPPPGAFEVVEPDLGRGDKGPGRRGPQHASMVQTSKSLSLD